eukprot:Gb_12134 [translate_table: standard]
MDNNSNWICSCSVKLLDILLLIYFFVMFANAPLLDAHLLLPPQVFAKLLRDLLDSIIREYGDYLLRDKPPFFVGLVWVEILVQWPLVIANIYGILTGKRWVRSTCFIFGVSTATSMAPVLADIYAMGEAGKQLMPVYFPFLIFPLMAIGRGLVPVSSPKPSAQNGIKRD